MYADDRVEEALKREYPYVFTNDYPGIPLIDMVKITDQPFTVGDIEVVPIPVIHGELPVLGFRFDNFTYITDANYISPESYNLIKGSEYLVLTALRRKSHYSHFTLNQSLEIIEKINPRQGFLTHISHLMGKHKQVSKELPENVDISF